LKIKPIVQCNRRRRCNRRRTFDVRESPRRAAAAGILFAARETLVQGLS
jgi:hypothetical protein